MREEAFKIVKFENLNSVDWLKEGILIVGTCVQEKVYRLFIVDDMNGNEIKSIHEVRSREYSIFLQNKIKPTTLQNKHIHRYFFDHNFEMIVGKLKSGDFYLYPNDPMVLVSSRISLEPALTYVFKGLVTLMNGDMECKTLCVCETVVPGAVRYVLDDLHTGIPFAQNCFYKNEC